MKNARSKELAFGLTTEHLTYLWDMQEGRCALCGGPLGYIGTGWSAASVDILSPIEGYVEGNVQCTHWRCNDAKSNMENADFINMCAAIAAAHFIPR